MQPKISSTFLGLSAQSRVIRYGLTIVLVCITSAATLYLPIIGKRAAFVLLFFGIIQASFWFGRYPGVLAALLSLIAVNVLVLLPSSIERHELLTLNAAFCFVSSAMVVTTGLHRKFADILYESQRDLIHAQTVGQIGSWRLNVRRNELRWSDENHRIFGIAKGTPLTYQTFLDVVHPDDRDHVDRMWQAGLRGEPYDIEHRLLVAGQVKWVRERAELEFADNGALLGGFGTTQDITERKRSEQALMESQQRYAGIFESVMDAIVILDTDQRILLFNAATKKMFGRLSHEIAGKSIKQLIPQWPSSNSVATGTFCRMGGFIADRAFQGVRSGGERFPIEVSISKCQLDDKHSYTVILRDVTEAVRAEVTLKERLTLQDQLSKVAASVPGLICSFRLRPDASACMPYASPVIESIYGFSLDEVSNDFSPVFDRIHPDDIGHIHGTIAESARTLQPWRDVYRYNHPTRGEVWHEGHSLPLREIDGSILWHGYIQDITERIEAEQALQERIARYELVLEGAQDAIWDWDVSKKCVHYSSRWKALRGYADHEVGPSEEEWSNNIHPDDQARILAAVRGHFEGKNPVFCEEYRIRCKDGSWKWILDRGIAQRDSEGKVIRMAGSESDITERKQSENALREQETELRLIMDATPALISYLDTDFRYLRVNATYENWFGIKAEQIIGQKAEDFIGGKAWNIVEHHLHRARAGEQTSFDQLIPYREDSPRWVHATYIPNIDSTGTVKGIVVHVFDIEDRVQSQQQIAQLNRHLQHRIEEMNTIFNTVPIGLSIADSINCQHIRGNPAIARMLGLPTGSELSVENELCPANLSVMHNDVELAKADLPMQRAVRGEAVVNQVIDIICPDGQVVTALCNASPLFDDDGTPRGAVGAFMDITALRQTERLLAKSQLQLRLLVEQAPLSIAMFDRNMNYLVTSRRWLEDFGCGYEDLTGRNHYDVNPDLPEEWKQVHRQAQAGAFLKNDDDIWIRADGTRHWLRWTAYPWTDPTGAIGGIIISCEDISARRKAEQELLNSEARLALIVDQVKAGYWDWDLISHQLFLSPEVKRQIGFEGNDQLNRREEWVSRVHPDDREFVLGIINAYIAGNQPSYEAEFRLRHKNGAYRWIHTRGVLLSDSNNRPYRMLGINLDITDYIRQKELSGRREKIEKSFRLYVAVQTAAVIAHELNQPLAAISSYSEVALHILQSGYGNEPKLTQILQNCSAQAQRAGEVMRQLLALLQKGEASSEPLDINISIQEAIELVKADGLLNGFEIETDFAADLPAVKTNSLQIQKILINLLHNGLESMLDQPNLADKITITTRRASADPAMVEVMVCDSGKGVGDITALKKIFQPFYTTKADGLGMGLAISRSLIIAHGGKMWAEQNAGNGITIHFTLPLIQ